MTAATSGLLLVGAVAALYALHRLGLWMEERGWIYYRRKRGGSGSLGTAFLEVQSMLEPSKKHILEISQKDESEDDDSGDPPEPGRY